MAKSRAFERIFVIILENALESAVRQDAFMLSLESEGVRLSDYHDVAHPSQPNYVVALAGVPAVPDDGCYDIDRTNVVDLLESKHITWKAYIEDLPEADKATPQVGLYYRKHNPFVSFTSIRHDPKRLAKVVNAESLMEDVRTNQLPEFCWYTPNIQNDGHSPPNIQPSDFGASVAYLSNWLRGFLPSLLRNSNFSSGTLTVVTFDESIPYADNHVYTALLGRMVRAGTTESERYTHYSLLRTVEENFDLGTMGNSDLTANWFEFLWGVRPKVFNWAAHRQ